jgi:hypothetical protein
VEQTLDSGKDASSSKPVAEEQVNTSAEAPANDASKNLEHAAGHVWGPSGKADCIEVVINPGVRPYSSLRFRPFGVFLADPLPKTLWADVADPVFVQTFPCVT